VAETRLAYGRALRALGDEAAANDQLAAARSELVRMGALGLVGEIDRELVALSG
jgi:hypothetical protein